MAGKNYFFYSEFRHFNQILLSLFDVLNTFFN